MSIDSGQITSPPRVKTQERCVTNLNEEYLGQGRDNLDLCLRDDASDGGDETEATNLMDWRLKASGNFPLTT